MNLSRSTRSEQSPPLLDRGVYELPILSEQGHPLYIIIDQDHRHVGPARELKPGMNRTVFVNALYDELDEKRPAWTPRVVQG